MPAEPAWIKRPRPVPDARIRLYCLPHAGGGASMFRAWADDLPADVEVAAVQLPGREERVMEPPLCTVRAIVEELARAIDPGARHALFGHSMGALVAFELCRELRRRGAPAAEHLFVSAHRAPQLPGPTAPIHDLPDDEFLAEVDRRYASIPAAARAEAEIMELLLPGLRADVAVCDTYAHVDDAPLDCPIHAFGGEQDDQVGRAEIEPWREQTRGGFALTMLPGDHFFVQGARRALLDAISATLREPGAGV